MQEIRVRGLSFFISAPYRAGQVVGEAEAQVLNLHWAKHLADSWTREVDKVQASTEGPLQSGQIEELQRRLTEHDSKYSFKLRHRPRHQREGQLQLTLREVAKQALDQQLRLTGRTLEGEEYSNLLMEFESLPSVVVEARKQVEDAQKVMEEALPDL